MIEFNSLSFKEICQKYPEQAVKILENKQKILYEYQKTINKIDDYLEYRYKSDNKETVKKNIINIIDNLTDELRIFI